MAGRFISFWVLAYFQVLQSKVVSTHRTGTHPEQPLPTGYNGIPFIVGQGDCLGCALGVCCNFLGYRYVSFREGSLTFFLVSLGKNCEVSQVANHLSKTIPWNIFPRYPNMGVSKNNGTPNHPF